MTMGWRLGGVMARMLVSLLALVPSGCLKTNRLGQLQSAPLEPESAADLLLVDEQIMAPSQYLELGFGKHFQFKEGNSTGALRPRILQTLTWSVDVARRDTNSWIGLIATPKSLDAVQQDTKSLSESLRTSNVRQIFPLNLDYFWALNGPSELMVYSRERGKTAYLSQPLQIPDAMRNILLQHPRSWGHLSSDEDILGKAAIVFLNWDGNLLSCQVSLESKTDICIRPASHDALIQPMSLDEWVFEFDGSKFYVRTSKQSPRIAIGKNFEDVYRWRPSIQHIKATFGTPQLELLRISESGIIRIEKHQLRMSDAFDRQAVEGPVSSPSRVPQIKFGPEFEFDADRRTPQWWLGQAIAKCKKLENVECDQSASSVLFPFGSTLIVKMKDGSQFEINAETDDVDIEIRMTPLSKEATKKAFSVIKELTFDIAGMKIPKCGGGHLNTSVALDSSANEKRAYEKFIAIFYSNPEYFFGLMRRASEYHLVNGFYLMMYLQFDEFLRSLAATKYVPLRLEPNTSGGYQRLEIRATRVITSAADWLERISFVTDSLWSEALKPESFDADFSRLRTHVRGKGIRSNYSYQELAHQFSTLRFSAEKYPLMAAAMKQDTCPFD